MYKPTFVFLQETKSSVEYAVRLLRHTHPRYVFGVDADGARGGLVVFCWAPFDVTVVCSSSHFVFCKISTSNGKVWYLLFLYGEAQHQYRDLLWLELQALLQNYTTYLIIGDINQVAKFEDKLGGAASIRGWQSFVDWQHSLQLIDIPFQGPRFTWTNNQQGDDLILERLDRAYATQSWLDEFPATLVRHLPFSTSDHGPILLQTTPPILERYRPYQIEFWCIHFPEIKLLLSDIWRLHIHGFPQYVLSRKLDLLRRKIKIWCLDKRLFWGINWKHIMVQLEDAGKDISTLSQGVVAQAQCSRLMRDAALTATY